MKFKNAAARPGARAALLAAIVLAFAAAPALAQEEGVPTVLDEPIVQVNNDVIMLSALKRENNEFKEILTKQRKLTDEEAEREIAQKQSEIIVNLINESLLVQKGKDMPRMSEDVEAEVNREILRVANQQGMKSIDELEAAMRAEKMSLSDIRETLRTQFMKQAVLQREVDAKVYYGLTDAELKKYFDQNRARFQSVTLSEIFLSLAGRSDAEVQAKARRLVAEARGGADFGQLALKNSEREQEGVRVAEKTQGRIQDAEGKLKWLLVSDLNPEIAKTIKDVKAGGVSEPLKTEEGYMLLRVHERDENFNENQVRLAITQERGEKERAAYLRKLRQEAYIKPADNYKDLIEPLLTKDTPQTTAASKQEAPKSSKDKDKKN